MGGPGGFDSHPSPTNTPKRYQTVSTPHPYYITSRCIDSMVGFRRPLPRRLTGSASIAWMVILAVAWLAAYSAQTPRWYSVLSIAKEFALLAALLGGAYGWGRLVLARWFRPQDMGSLHLYSFGVGFGILWSATFVAAMLHVIGTAWPWLLLGGGWLSLILVIKPTPRFELPAVPNWTAIQWLLLLAMGASLIHTLVVWALVPPIAWDEVSYHLPIPRIYIQAGGFISIPSIVHSNWPSGMEMLNMLGLLMGTDILPHLSVTAMTVLTAVCLARIARRWFDHDTAWLAPTLYLTLPMVSYLAGVTLVEGALGFFGVLAVWSGAVWLENRSCRTLVLAGLFGGLAASIKLTGAAIPIAVATTALAHLVLRHQASRSHLTQLVVYGLVAFTVVAPWYAKSAIYTGNPIWPFLYSIFGGRDWDSLGDQMHTSWLYRPNLSPTLWHYLGGFWHLAAHPERFGGMSPGAASVVLGPLSVLFADRRRWAVGYLASVSIVVYTLWFFTTHQTRFLMGVIPAITLLASFSFCEFLKLWPRQWTGVVWAVMILYLIAISPYMESSSRQRFTDHWLHVAGRVTRDDFLATQVDGYAAFQFANDHLPADSLVLLAPWETRGYYLHRNHIWANPIAQRVIKWEQFNDPNVLAGRLRSSGITHIFWNSKMMIEDTPCQDHIMGLLAALLDQYGQVLYDNDGYRIYELVTSPPGTLGTATRRPSPG